MSPDLIICECPSYEDALSKARQIAEILSSHHTTHNISKENSFRMKCDFGYLQAVIVMGNPEQDVVMFTIDYHEESFEELLDFLLALDLARNTVQKSNK